MAYARSLLLTALLLSPLVACTANTIEIETMEGPGSASEGDPGTGTTGTGTTFESETITVGTTTVGRPDMGNDSADVDSGDLLDLPPEPGDTETLLLAIDTSISPGLPLQGIVWLQRGGAGTVDLELQWLSLDQGSTTEPRALVGDVYAYAGIPVGPDGAFTWDTGVLLIPGAANPITGSDIVASVSAEVVPMGSPYCGRVSGLVMQPIRVPLDGSTHAMTTVASELELPLEFPVACP